MRFRSTAEALDAREFTALRIQAHWSDSPAARRLVTDVLARHGVTDDPRRATREQIERMALDLFDLDGRFPEAERAALEAFARFKGRDVRAGGGSRSDAARLARDWFPEVPEVVLGSYDDDAESSAQSG